MRLVDFWRYAIRHKRPCMKGHIRTSNGVRRGATWQPVFRRNGHAWKIPSFEQIW